MKKIILAALVCATGLAACSGSGKKTGSGADSTVKALPDSSARVDSMINKAQDTLKAH